MGVVLAAVAVALGTGIGNGRAGLARPLTLLAVAVLAIAASVWRAHERTTAIAVLVLLASAAGASAAWRSEGKSDAVLPALARTKAVVDACGEVREIRPRSVIVRVDHIERGRTAWDASEELRVSGRAVRGIRPGERFCAKGALHAPRPGYNEPPLLVAERVGERSTGSRFRIAAAIVREHYASAAARALPKTEAGLLLGMTDGDTALLPAETVEAFRTTGLAHLIAVSGENVAVLLVVVLILSRLVVRRGRWLRALVAMPPLLFFAFLTGLEPSVMRAVITAGIGLAITAEGRTSDALRLTLCAFIVLILASPDVLFALGFQLSFGATFGLIVWSGPLAIRLERVLGSGPIARVVVIAASTTIAAQASVAPLLAWRFGRVPALGGLANLLAVPIAPFITMGGLATLSAASLFRFLDWAPATLRVPLDFVLACARTFARLPLASIGASVLVGAAMAAALAGFVASTGRVRAACVAFVVVCGCAAAGQAVARDTCDSPSVVALDIGQGSAVLLRTAAHAVLVDTGPANGPIVDQLTASGVHHLDAIFITHSHIDHALGSLSVFKHISVDRLYGPEELHWTSGAQAIAAAAVAGAPFTSLAEGDVVDAGDIHLDVLWPRSGPAPPFSSDLVDAYNLVMRARITNVDVFLPGDIRAPVGSQLARDLEPAPILVAPHHGSKDLDAGFVDAVDPRLTLITVGRPNPYGLPAPQALRSYASHGDVFRTDDDGRVTVCLTLTGPEVWTTK